MGGSNVGWLLIVSALAGALEANVPSHQYVLVDDIQVPHPKESREFASLASIPFTDKAKLWPLGVVRYYIDSENTNAGNPAAAPLDADDDRILSAVDHWEYMTCIRFTKCASAAACATPYIRFASDADSCNSPVGMAAGGVGQINLGEACGTGNVIHEIGHSLGMQHEQTRNDRDSYVMVNYSTVNPDKRHNFDKTGPSGRDVGPYDYGSIMHYTQYAFSTGGSTILSPRPIGQRDGLSAGDVAAIQFLYNNCSATYDRPQCVASRVTGEVIPYGSAYAVEFNVENTGGTGVAVSFSETTATGDVTFTEADGALLADSAKVGVSFVPAEGQMDQLFTLAATFTSAAGSQPATTCAITVRIADSNLVCYGVSSTDPLVCSGRGTCTDSAITPCQCTSPYGGLRCQGYETCPDNVANSFDEAGDLWSGDAAVATDLYVTGGASMKVNGSASYRMSIESVFGWMSFHLALGLGANPEVSFNDIFGGNCFSILTTGSGALALSGDGWQATNVVFDDRVFYLVEVRMDSATGTLDLKVDGHLEIEGFSMRPSTMCASRGVEVVAAFDVWLDELDFYCHSHITLGGSLTAATQVDLAAGGAELVLELQSGEGSWVGGESMKQAVADALTGDRSSPTGWNALKSVLLDASLVTINTTTIVVGPLRSAAGFSELLSTRVNVAVEASWLASGELPSAHKDLFFTVPGRCENTAEFSFDDPAATLSTSFSYDAAVVDAGSGSLRHDGAGAVASFPFGASQPGEVKFAARVADATSGSYHSLEVMAGSVVVGQWITGRSSKFWYHQPGKLSGLQSVPGVTCASNTWYTLSFTLTWGLAQLESVGFRVDGDLVVTVDVSSLGITAVDSFKTHAFAIPAYLDSFAAVCTHQLPAFTVEPACPVPGDSAFRFTITSGSARLSSTRDEVAIVPAAAADCGDALAECGDVGGCSRGVGVLVQDARNVQWSAGSLPSLAGAAGYKLCYWADPTARWELLDGSFTTCAATNAPATGTPPTLQPATPAPATKAPPTMAPPTSAPAPTTNAPATNAPPTSARSTSVPGVLGAPSSPSPNIAEESEGSMRKSLTIAAVAVGATVILAGAAFSVAHVAMPPSSEPTDLIV
ncbi:Nematocyst expressed protein 6 [Diplonema papillatum]|nr:Nematocyst expressed protein 6 [Diplonema papillatum]